MDKQPSVATGSRTAYEISDVLDLAEDIAPFWSNAWTSDFFEEIHGADAKHCAAYQPTRLELRQIVRHWIDVKLDIGLELFFLEDLPTDRDLQLRSYAEYRLRKLACVLGDDTIEQVAREARENARRRLGADTWRIFTDGTSHERAELHEMMVIGHRYLELKREDKALMEKAHSFLTANPSRIYVDDAGDLWSFTDDGVEYKGDDPEARLMLRITIPDGVSTVVRDHSVIRPYRWQAPYGLR